MTREVAIKAIQEFIGWFKEDSLIRKALEMAIQALEQNESAAEWYKLFVEKLDEQEPCDDAISREDATAEFIKWQTEVAYAFGRDYLGVRIIQSEIDTIRVFPSVTQKGGNNNVENSTGCMGFNSNGNRNSTILHT